ncbi:ATP synthase subunit b [Synechocystis sp. PCC 6803]|jgi:F-type H+-transporting ATPase subunit b|uniref:ATP synthase subunit b n=1 Tax=Synechocystis sp. (strain ATCC 27184 / PCC 6803 / Kazusa) TaxID=1111708 RepID=ATPF_SYNY3|nr:MULTISPECIES: F0F1 ATP synthase subunit B [unclassified Synechocystis]P27181.2 RecName: Full=ATP synthase subunit b; AltName: Full=ATP synthase F(0) sector subunit b; AltName: Full=ATPase subunit I; AltName: Full=F-type ATPase subunit b; Short=F-ATPase subunit b [Synechocystis sp. PCC 6803 substr. Kazusa]BAM50442.1 ATP synthase F0F1 subunit B [Synechocystis sp. PCC 6803] [Bacillus subtilis BEST7613]AGF50426.1 ATP synthase subunit b [Synechocystis sp. PCC 6803]ALJ66514.1 ATP synthase F0F1 sub
MLNTLFILAAEAHEAGEGGFGINLDFLEANLFNLAILLGIIIYYAPKTLGKILGDRRQKIADAIEEAETRQRKSAQILAEEEKKLAQAKAEAARIVQEAGQRAEVAKQEIATQTEADLRRMQEAAAQDLGAEQERVIAELKRRIAEQAVAKAEADLRDRLNEDTQDRLIERSIAQLGGR